MNSDYIIMNERHKDNKIKIIAFYLPQYHSIPENDEWWGKGFTEWTNVKKAQPIFSGHIQPKKPLNDNYYNLLDDDVKKWQVEIAKKAGLYGFCYYHYWFNGKLLLEKPAEQMLTNKSIDFPFCFSWANEPWSRSWKGETKNVLMPQDYGDQNDWKKHFEYLLPFFSDERYIKENGKPVFIIYKPDIFPQYYEMMKYWNELAKCEGFPGIYWGFQFPSGFRDIKNSEIFDFGIEFEPLYTRTAEQDFINISTFRGKTKLLIKHPITFFKISNRKIRNNILKKPVFFDYSKTCEKIISRKPIFSNSVPGMFTSWDKTPRNGKKATVYKNSSPELFEQYMQKQIIRAKEVYNCNYLFITAWNEWGEGAYLEPDVVNRFSYLEALSNSQNNSNTKQ